MIEKRIAAKAAYWYYTKGLTQGEIAEKLGYSRQRVNKMISSLVSGGVVEIVINGLDDPAVLLELKLERAFSLDQVVVADCAEDGGPTLAGLGKKAALFLDDYIQDGKVIGVSWGNTLSETIRNVRVFSKKNCSVVQLVGGLSTSEQAIKPDEIVRMLAQKFDCGYNMLYAPAIMHSAQARQVLSQQEMLKETFERIEQCDIVIAGIGQVDKSATLVHRGYLQCDEVNEMLSQGYVGDICLNHFKTDGSLGKHSLSDRVMGVDMDTLKRIPAVIAIAGGENKVQAVLGALNTGCVDVLITDTALAAKLGQIVDSQAGAH